MPVAPGPVDAGGAGNEELGVAPNMLLSGGLDRLTAARVIASVYFVCGGAVAAIVAFVPQPPGSNLPAMIGVCMCGVVLGPIIWFLPWGRWPLRASLVLAVLAIGFVSGFDAASATDGFRYGLFDVVVFSWVGLSQARGTSIALTPVLVGGYLGPLLAAGHGWDTATSSVLYAIPSCVVTGESVAWVADRLRWTHSELVSTSAALVRSERLSAVGEMATVIGHELRNPLGAITNAHYLMRQSVGQNPVADRYLSLAEREVTRAVHLAEDLSTFARGSPPSMTSVDLRAVVDEALLTSPTPPGVEVSIDVAPLRLTADRAQLVQIICNLVENAYQAMPNGGTLHISASGSEGTAVITVRDSGQGLDSSTAGRAFEPFVTTKADGSGLGLAIVRRLVDAHGGEVSLRGEDVGALATVRLPMADETVSAR